MRNNLGYYKLMVVVIPNKNWKNLSFTYYKKGVVTSDETELKHIDRNISKLLTSGHGHQLIQTMFSIDGKDVKGFKLVVLSFQTNITEWCGRVKKPYMGRDRFVARINTLM